MLGMLSGPRSSPCLGSISGAGAAHAMAGDACASIDGRPVGMPAALGARAWLWPFPMLS